MTPRLSRSLIPSLVAFLLIGTGLPACAADHSKDSDPQPDPQGQAAPEKPGKAERNGPAKKEDPNNTYEMLNLFGDVFEKVKKSYVQEVSDKDLIEAAINGMLTSLDPHSNYLNSQQFKEMQEQTRGEFGGLGIEVTMDSGLIKVISPIDDTPASKAGIKSGDYISEIDGEAVMGMTLSEAVDKMRGPVGSAIKLTVIREGAPEALKLSLNRDTIKIKSIKSHAEGDIGYVRITSFSEETGENLNEAVAQLRKDIPNMKGLVLDLRNNPGGLLDQAVAVSDSFLDHGEIVSTRDRNPADTKRYSAEKGDVLDGLPMVVLINQGSASASEIVAGALQDQKRALVMGVKSFGKGSVQTLIPLENGGAMRLTTSRYFTPSGHSIQAKGITPDIIVAQAKVTKLEDNAMPGFRSEAELKGRLANPEDEAKAKEKTVTTTTTTTTTTVKPGAAPAKKDDNQMKDANGGLDPSEDYQLQRSLDLLHAIAIYRKDAEANH